MEISHQGGAYVPPLAEVLTTSIHGKPPTPLKTLPTSSFPRPDQPGLTDTMMGQFQACGVEDAGTRTEFRLLIASDHPATL